MKKTAVVLFACIASIATVAIAAEATDPTVKARQELMDVIGASAQTLGKMAQGETPFDAAAAEAAKAAMIEASAGIAAAFEPQATDPATKAKPEIWTNWDDFVAKGEALNAAATAADVSSVEAIGASMGAIGGACKDCHSAYRL
jgi:cytochrome c556